MKKHILILLIVMVMAMAGQAQVQFSEDFVSSAFALNASTTKTHGTDFTSEEYIVPRGTYQVLLTVTFTRAAGSASKVAFYFQVSHNNKASWADFVDPVTDLEYIEIATNHAVVSGTTVRVSRLVPITGISHIRLSKVVNNDTANNLTAVNAAISF